MRPFRNSCWRPLRGAQLALVIGASSLAAAEEPIPSAGNATVEVTATRTAVDVQQVPASISVIDGAELEARNVQDLPGALSLLAGVSVAPGGDGGPAGSVPELWGLREFDAFLLVVDGIPWGGAFLPALQAVDLNDVERIELLRGAAPVTYGATSFVGVIHVIHRAAGSPGRVGRVWLGRYGSGGAAYSFPLRGKGDCKQSLSVDLSKQGFSDDRAEAKRAHARYRGALETAWGSWRFDADLLALRQTPASPFPREGKALTDKVPIDANHNPPGAKLDDDRFQAALSFEHPFDSGKWISTLSLTHTKRETRRGFLVELEDIDPNAFGYEQETKLTDIYFDSHLELPLTDKLHLLAGFDHQYGKGEQDSRNFEYFAALDGSNAQSLNTAELDEATRLEDRRRFSGLYAQVEWTPSEALRVELGARLNRTDEKIEGEATAGVVTLAEEEGKNSRTITRGSGVVGLSGRVWSAGRGSIWAFVDYRNTFKPAVVDFGPEAEGDLLDPEEADSWEAGLKGAHDDRRLEWSLTGFRMNFQNIVLPQAVDGVPTLVNAGEQRFEGVELEGSYRFASNWRLQVGVAAHSSRFLNFAQLFGDTLTQLRGNRLEMTPLQLAGVGLSYFPKQGWTGFATWNYTGNRFLNKRNTAPVDGFTLWNAGVGYRFASSELRLDGTNLGDRRDPISESELGDAQYYLQPARSFSLSYIARY